MNCKYFEDLFSLYLEDDLSPEKRISFELHLDSCSECRELFALIKETNEALSVFPEIEVPLQLRNRLYEIPIQKKRFSFKLDVLLRPALQPVFAGATIFLILISFYAFHPDRLTINKTINQEIHKGYSKVGQLYTQAESFAVSLFDQTDTLLDSLKNSKFFKGKED
ncbi:MAG: zf-HC2 domain-containing protein [Candidatus Aminicenantes bacterium]|nr:zf-HC2 domain-containing protein [Candidatus Aminicenantes bacterium]